MLPVSEFYPAYTHKIELSRSKLNFRVRDWPHFFQRKLEFEQAENRIDFVSEASS